MTARNAKGREIWFRRILWSYHPVHWKGVVLLCGCALPTVLSALWVMHHRPSLSVLPMVVGVAFLLWCCARHS